MPQKSSKSSSSSKPSVPSGYAGNSNYRQQYMANLAATQNVNSIHQRSLNTTRNSTPSATQPSFSSGIRAGSAPTGYFGNPNYRQQHASSLRAQAQLNSAYQRHNPNTAPHVQAAQEYYRQQNNSLMQSYFTGNDPDFWTRLGEEERLRQEEERITRELEQEKQEENNEIQRLQSRIAQLEQLVGEKKSQSIIKSNQSNQTSKISSLSQLSLSETKASPNNVFTNTFNSLSGGNKLGGMDNLTKKDLFLSKFENKVTKPKPVQELSSELNTFEDESNKQNKLMKLIDSQIENSELRDLIESILANYELEIELPVKEEILLPEDISEKMLEEKLTSSQEYNEKLVKIFTEIQVFFDT